MGPFLLVATIALLALLPRHLPPGGPFAPSAFVRATNRLRLARARGEATGEHRGRRVHLAPRERPGLLALRERTPWLSVEARTTLTVDEGDAVAVLSASAGELGAAQVQRIALEPEARAHLAAHVAAGGVVLPAARAGVARVAAPVGLDTDSADVADRLVDLAERLEAAARRPLVPTLAERATTDGQPPDRALALHALSRLVGAEAEAATARVAAHLTGERPLLVALDDGEDVRLAAALRLVHEARPADLERLHAARARADARVAPVLDRAIDSARARAPVDGAGRLAVLDAGRSGALGLADEAVGALRLADDEGAS